MGALVDRYSKEELTQIIQQSKNLNEVIDKLGYATHSGSNSETVKKRIIKYNIDISHFNSVLNPIKRTEDNIFIKNSTASQATLRRWYKKGEYTPYECSICKMKPIWQGKELTLILDHINGLNHDDRLENLRWVCPNCNQQLETTGSRNCTKLEKKDIKLNEEFYCIECGKKISNKAIRCADCNNKNRKIALENMPVTREELKKLIRDIPFTTIANQYGVTDNTIRKWCDKFNLPRKKRDINLYSNEEWAIL